MLTLLCGFLLSLNIGGEILPVTLTDYFFQAANIYAYKNGESQLIEEDILVNQIKSLTMGAYYSPGYGVANNKQVIEQRKDGIWLEFNYHNQHSFAGMPFSKLLIEIKPDLYGLNIIRFNDGQYSGSCYYLNLATSTTNFYNFLTSIT